MWKNKKFIISILIAVILLGATAGAALAADTKVPRRANILARVAQLLNIGQDKLESAFKQASKEQRDLNMDTLFQKWVDAGKLTKEQATQYKNWLKSRPDVSIPLRGDRFFTKDIDTALQKLVDAGKITKDQAAQYKKWINSKPNIELPKLERPSRLPFGKPNQVPPTK